MKDEHWSAELSDWRFMYQPEGVGMYIVGDNPIVTRGVDDHDPVNCLNEFMFPISDEILLVNTRPPRDVGITCETMFAFNIAIVDRADRFVACKDKVFLDKLVTLYKDVQSSGMTSSLIPSLFNGAQQASGT
jgi:hypothetical protein